MELVLPLETDEFAGCKIRRTPEVPPRVSVYDLIAVVKGVSDKHARADFARVKEDHPEVALLGCYFTGSRNTECEKTPAFQRHSDVTTIHYIVYAVMNDACQC